MTSALEGLENCGLHKRTPYVITGVSQTQFSVARFYGGSKYQGESYTYNPITDELVRNDVLKWQKKHKSVSKKTIPQDTETSQQSLQI